jgi:hypothetical protein
LLPYEAELPSSQTQLSVLRLFSEKLKIPRKIIVMKGQEASTGETNNNLYTELFKNLVQYSMKLLARLIGVENVKNF